MLGERLGEDVPARSVGDEIQIVACAPAAPRRAAPICRDWRSGRAAALCEVGVVGGRRRRSAWVSGRSSFLAPRRSTRRSRSDRACSRMPRRSRLTKTAAIWAARLPCAASLSTNEARISACLRARQRQVGSPLGPGRGQRLGHRAAHPLDQLLALLAIAIEISLGQQSALGRDRRSGSPSSAGACLYQRDDLGAGQALGDC